jgi:hypothetical protein
MKNIFIRSLIFIIIFSWFNPTRAWLYPEHRDIMLIAIQKLPTAYRTSLDKLWVQARIGYEFRLSESVIVSDQGLKPEFIDYAAWPAIAGDHSCSAENMLHNILETDWILAVADITAQLKINLAFSEDRVRRINSVRESDLKLQGADPEYATRAGSNNVHFLLSLPDVDMDVFSYIFYCTKEGAELNSISAYAWYHYNAILKASRLANGNLSSEERSAITLAMLADESYAIHFLQDMFAAGHTAGTWGDASQRKGTHDYYNERGLKVSTWDGDNAVLTGDAWMRTEDAERAAFAVRLSVMQILDVVSGKHSEFNNLSRDVFYSPDSFNVCQNNYVPAHETNTYFDKLLEAVILKTPVPALEEGLGDLPRFRAEVGTFVGFSPAARGGLIFGGFGEGQETIGVIGGLEISGRFGAGLDGVINESGDGLAFIDLGYRQDASSSTEVLDVEELRAYGNIYSTIPGRSAFSSRLRLPFYVLPGDLLILGPLLFFIDQEALVSVGVSAVNGGLIPWQRGIETSFGRFQFVLGREVAVYLYGRTKTPDALVTYSTGENGIEDLFVISYRSTQLEFPILEYRPFRSFDADQRSSLFIQIYGAADFPHDVKVLESVTGTTIPPELETVWSLGLRLIFDWRHYL